jgi:CheY-like chemotaxis protein
MTACKTGRLLLVEDHVDTIKLYKLVLGRRGYEVEVAQSVRTALEMIEANDYNLILSDLQLPDGIGSELVGSARSRGIPAIAISGHAGKKDHLACKAAGFMALLPKPIDLQSLLNAVANYCRTG